MRHVPRGGSYFRVADPEWHDPLAGEHARGRGGRWNPPHSFPVVYVNASVDVARAQVRHRIEPRGIRPEDLDPDAAPVLIHTNVPDDDYVDAVTDGGLAALGLPTTYPQDARGLSIPHDVCQPIGLGAWNDGERGIACRSAARTATAGMEELAFFGRRELHPTLSQRFGDWFW